MTKKANLYKEEEKKKMKNKKVPVNRHSLKGKRSVKPSKQTKEMDVEKGKRATKPADQREAVNLDKGKRPMKPSEQTIVLNVDKEKRSPKLYVQTQVVNVDKRKRTYVQAKVVDGDQEKGSPKPYELTQVVNMDKRKRTSVQAKVVDGDKEKISAKPFEQIQVVNVDKRKRTSVQTKVVDGDKGKTPVKPSKQTIVLDVVKGKRFVKPSEQTRLVNVDKDFSTRSPLIQGNGNFGSIDADTVASMRYTECRLEALTKAVLLADLEQNMRVLEAEDSSSQPQASSPQPPVGGKIPVTFDIYGSPVGPESSKFTSFVCQCVMTHISITYERWKLVPKGLKDRLWEAITDIYEIPSCWRKKILSHASISWKDLKARLRESKIHMQTRPLEEIKKDNPPNIRAEDWVLFVDQAFTSKALKKRTQAKEARSKKFSLRRTGRAGAASQPQDSAPQPPAGGKKSVTFDIFGSPVGPGSTKFTSFVGQCARTHIRITYEAWKLVPEGLKDRLWEAITDIYEVPSCWRKKILSCANISWKDRKAKLRDSKIYKHTRPLEEIKKDKPPNVRAKDWALFVDQAFTPKALKKRTQAREARAKNFALHRTGRTGAARIRHKMEQENPGKKIKRTELFVGIHTSQNGTCLNEEFGRKLDRVREITENNPSSTSLDIDHDPVADVFGKDSRGRVRGYGTVSRRILKGTKPMIDQLGSQNKSHPPVEKRIRDIVMDVVRTEFNHLLDLHTPVSNASQVQPVNGQNRTSGNVTQVRPVNEHNHTSRNVTQVQPVNEPNHASRNATLVRPVNEHNHTSRIVTQVRPVNEQNHTYRNVTQVCPVNEQNHTSRNVTQVPPVNEQNHKTRNVTGLQPVNEQNHTSRNVTGLQPVNEQTRTSRNVTQERPVNEQNHTSRNVTQVQPVNEQIQTSRNVIEDVDLLDLAGTAVAIGRATLAAGGVGPYMCDVIIDKVLEPKTPIALDPAKRTMSQVDVGDIIKWPTVLLAKHCV